MTRFGCAALGLMLAAAPVQAAQSISERMADCAGLMEVAADWAQHDDDRAHMLAASEGWLEASVARARAEGAHYPNFLAISMQDEAVSLWQARGAAVLDTEDYARLSQACLRMDRDLGLGIHGH